MANNSTRVSQETPKHVADQSDELLIWSPISNGDFITPVGNLSFWRTLTPLTANYTTQNLDSGSTLMMTNTVNTTVTISNTMPPNTWFKVLSMSTANVVIANQAGMSLGSKSGAYTVTNTYAEASVLIVNSSFAVIGGDV